MTEEIILVRENHKIPWGFRLSGGKDFNSPLTVSRITKDSIAEKHGLKVGDLITNIKNEKTTNLMHANAQRLIIESGNFLKFIVLRGTCPDIQQVLTSIRGLTPVSPFDVEKKKTMSSVSTDSINSLCDDSFEFLDQSENEYLDEYHEPTEQEIDQMLLENAEIIEENGKNVLGVNFRRFIPKCEFIKDSAVFHLLQEEQVHRELSEKEQLKKWPNKRFSTFLTPPNRPIPTTKCTKDELKENQEKITKNENTNLETGKNQYSYSNIENKSLNEPNDQTNYDQNVECQHEVTNKQENKGENSEQANEILTNAEIKRNDSDTIHMQEIIEGTNDEINTFENQLNNIKNTLNALEELPSMIQSQLATIQSQINHLFKTKDCRTYQTTETLETIKNETIEILDTNEMAEEQQNEPIIEEYNDNFSENDNEFSESKYENELNYEENKNEQSNHEQNEIIQFQIENGNAELEDNHKFEQQDVKEQNLYKRRICPLTPLPRPVVLPGGRIWRKPQDAYNEEFIAETLISQAEVLVGSTLGVNFRKYEPPKFDVNNSAVYKLIHNIESKERGLQERDTIPALQDYYQSPISARHFYCATLAEKVHEVCT
ncbi:hypothetical protein PGB90_005142 [Kerria lacca]